MKWFLQKWWNVEAPTYEFKYRHSDCFVWIDFDWLHHMLECLWLFRNKNISIWMKILLFKFEDWPKFLFVEWTLIDVIDSTNKSVKIRFYLKFFDPDIFLNEIRQFVEETLCKFHYICRLSKRFFKYSRNSVEQLNTN